MSEDAAATDDAFVAPVGGGPAPLEKDAGLWDVGAVDDYADETITGLVLGDSEIVVIKQAGEFYALPDRCTHQRYPLNDGELLDGKIRCVHHGATFDLHTGRPTLPAVVKIRLFTVDVIDGRVLVRLQER